MDSLSSNKNFSNRNSFNFSISNSKKVWIVVRKGKLFKLQTPSLKKNEMSSTSKSYHKPMFQMIDLVENRNFEEGEVSLNDTLSKLDMEPTQSRFVSTWWEWSLPDTSQVRANTDSYAKECQGLHPVWEENPLKGFTKD